MNNAQVFSQMFDLELAFASAIEIQLEPNLTDFIGYGAVPTSGNSLAFFRKCQRSIGRFEQEYFWDLHQLVSMNLRDVALGLKVKISQLKDSLVSLQVMKKLVPQTGQIIHGFTAPSSLA